MRGFANGEILLVKNLRLATPSHSSLSPLGALEHDARLAPGGYSRSLSRMLNIVALFSQREIKNCRKIPGVSEFVRCIGLLNLHVSSICHSDRMCF